MRFTFASKNVASQQVDAEFKKYDNGNHALLLVGLSGVPVMKCTHNPGIVLDENEIALKTWEENEGVAEALLNAGIIDGAPKFFVRSGNINIPVYHLGSIALEEIKNLG